MLHGERMYVRFLEWLAVFLLATVGGVVVLAVYSWYTNTHILYLNKPIQVLEQKVPAGGMLTMRMDYCKSATAGLAEVHYSLDNPKVGVIYPLFDVEVTNLEQGCHVVDEVLPIPPVKPGNYHLQMIRIYVGAFGSQAPVLSQSQEFEVVQ